MLDRRSEQRRRNLFGIHPAACTCVDCSRKKSGLPPLSRLPTQPTEENWEAFTKSLNLADATQSPSDTISDPEQEDDGPALILPTEPATEEDGASEPGVYSGTAQSPSYTSSEHAREEGDDLAVVSTTPAPSEENCAPEQGDGNAPAVVSPTMPPPVENSTYEKPLVRRLWDVLRRRGRGTACRFHIPLAGT